MKGYNNARWCHMQHSFLGSSRAQHLFLMQSGGMLDWQMSQTASKQHRLQSLWCRMCTSVRGNWRLHISIQWYSALQGMKHRMPVEVQARLPVSAWDIVSMTVLLKTVMLNTGTMISTKLVYLSTVVDFFTMSQEAVWLSNHEHSTG